MILASQLHAVRKKRFRKEVFKNCGFDRSKISWFLFKIVCENKGIKKTKHDCMTLAFSLRRLLSALCKNLSRCLKITRGWSHKRGLGNEVLTNFPIVAHPEGTLFSSVEDVLLNTHKTDQDLGPTVRWHSEVLLVFNLPLIHFLCGSVSVGESIGVIKCYQVSW